MKTAWRDRKLDMVIAKHVLKLKPKKVKGLLGITRYILEDPYNAWEIGLIEDNLPNYSKNMRDAQVVIDKMFKDEWSIHVEGSEYYNAQAGGYDVTFVCKCGARGKYTASSKFFAEAVCLAALEACTAHP